MDRKYSEPQPSDRGVAHEHREANPGEPFNPWHEACGFYPQDVLGRQRKLLDATGNLKMVTAGQKRLYERLVRFAGKDGRCFPSQDTLARELGRSDRQVRKDLASLESFKLLRHTWRDGRRNNNYEFLWHPIFDNRNHRSAQVSESSPSERNSSSAQTESDGAVDRNPNSAQPDNLSGTPRALSGTSRQFDRNCGSSNIIRESESEKASGGELLRSTQAERLDDETCPHLIVVRNPEFEFRARITARHGGLVDAERLLQLVKGELNGSVSLAEFLDEDTAITTAPDRLKNPIGHYRSLARRLMRRHGLGGVEATMSAVQKMITAMAEQERTLRTSGTEKCLHCKNPLGKGVLVAEGRIEPCPVCSTTEWATYVRKKAESDARRRHENRQRGTDE